MQCDSNSYCVEHSIGLPTVTGTCLDCSSLSLPAVHRLSSPQAFLADNKVPRQAADTTADGTVVAIDLWLLLCNAAWWTQGLRADKLAQGPGSTLGTKLKRTPKVKIGSLVNTHQHKPAAWHQMQQTQPKASNIQSLHEALLLSQHPVTCMPC